MIQPASQPYIDEIRKKWETASLELYARNGTNPKFHKGGQDIVGNPALRDTMAAMAEGYIPICARKAELFDQRHHANSILLGNAEGDSDVAMRNLDKIGVELKAIDAELVLRNQHNLGRILAKDSGLEQETKRQSEGRPSMDIKLDCARKVISAVARAVVGTCQSHLYVLGDAVDYIPRKFEPSTEPVRR